jgi:tetratricopeptide (TPR) repeat protein
MSENFIQGQYDVTKKSKIKEFYESKKYLIYSCFFIFIICLGSVTIYSENKEKKKIVLSENYIQAKVYLENGDRDKALKLLKKNIFDDSATYSTLSFFLILDLNLINDKKEISDLFDHVLENNKFEKELKNLLVYKKALFESSFLNESKLLKSINPLLKTDSLWRPHALLLLGNYYFSRKEYLKAKEFYSQILSIPNIQKNFYDQATSKLFLIKHE